MRMQRMRLPHTSKIRLVAAGFGAILIVATILSTTLSLQKARAFELLTQSDWSGGVGTNPTDQYASVNGINAGSNLTLDTGNGTNQWCNTANCDNSWTNRQRVRVNNTASYGQTDVSVMVTVPYKPAMASDFADLRFTNSEGDTDFPYYIESKTDGAVANAWVRVDEIIQGSSGNDFAMYYGNPSADTRSDASTALIFNDGFQESSTTANLEDVWTNDIEDGGSNIHVYPNENIIYVANTTTKTVYKYAADGTLLLTIGGPGNGDGQFQAPTGIYAAPISGYVYVVDSVKNNVQVFGSGDGAFLFKFGTSGTDPDQFDSPYGITACGVEGYGNVLFVADTNNNRLSRWTADGTFISASDSSPNSPLNKPMGLTSDYVGVDGSCRIAIADSLNNRIVTADYSLNMTPSETLIRFGEEGTGDGQFIEPRSITSTGRDFYISDSLGNRVQRFNQFGQFTSKWGQEGTNEGQFSQLTGVSVVFDSTVYAIEDDPGRIQVFEAQELGSQWAEPGNFYGRYYTDDGVLTLNRSGTLYSANTFDRSKDRTFEVSFSVDSSRIDCSTESNPVVLETTLQAAAYYYRGTSNTDRCVEGVPHFGVNSIKYDGISEYSIPEASSHILGESTIRVKVVQRQDGGSRWFLSNDNSRNFIEVESVPLGIDTSDTQLGIINTGDSDVRLRVNSVIGYNTVDADVSTSLGIEEFQGGYTGRLESVVYDLGSNNTTFGNISIDTSGTGNVHLYARAGENGPAGQDYYFCGALTDGQALSSSSCDVTTAQRYVQYMLVMADDSGADLAVESISLEYAEDSVAPDAPTNLVLKRSQSGSVIADGAWTNAQQPYVSWTAGSDNAGGMGLTGYCIYVGTDSNGDPATQGIISTSSPLSVPGCEYATSDTSFNADAFELSNLNHTQTYYVRIASIDVAGNISGDVLSGSFKYDDQPPGFNTLVTFPTAVNTTTVSVSWIVQPGNDPFPDPESSTAGLRYCFTSLILGLSGCQENDENWYGPAGVAGPINDSTDVFPQEAGILTTSPNAADRLDSTILGYNGVAVAIVDNAGNASSSPPQIFRITQDASSGPANLQVSPTSNNANAFSFTWSPPADLVGSQAEADYCWTVNEPIASGGANCHWTGRGVYSLLEGPYATQQGLNTLYIATKDVTGNFDHTKSSNVTFTTNTSAPGATEDLDIADVSIRATSAWRLALSWTAPTQPGAGIATYRILRSTDNASFTQVGSTNGSNTSFVDSGLAEVLYYYKVQACDNANSCGVASNVASRKPSGRFTEPARLTADSDQPKVRDVTTRKASILWYTDRDSDSKIAIGTSPGNYFDQEIGNSAQVTQHTVNLNNLQPGTTYYYVAKWTDQDGNTGQSAENSFTTQPAPAISDVETRNLTVTSANVFLKTKQTSKVSLYYGPSENFGNVETIDTSQEESTYTIALDDLEDGTKYFFKLNGWDADNNEYQGNIYSFTTPARPQITNLQVLTVEGEPSSTKRITWNTNVPTTSVVAYTPEGGAEQTAVSGEVKTAHETIIRGLLDDKNYSLTVRATDNDGNTAVSGVQTFRTALDTRAPKISNVTVETSVRGSGPEARGQIVVSWRTDEPASSQVAYGQGQGEGFGNRTPQDNRLTTEHTMVISDIATSAVYRLRVVSEDRAGNSVLSDPQNAIIGRASDNVFTIIFNALQKVFGVK